MGLDLEVHLRLGAGQAEGLRRGGVVRWQPRLRDEDLRFQRCLFLRLPPRRILCAFKALITVIKLVVAV